MSHVSHLSGHTNGHVNGHAREPASSIHGPPLEQLLSRAPDRENTCMARLPGGRGWCLREDKHKGDCSGIDGEPTSPPSDYGPRRKR